MWVQIACRGTCTNLNSAQPQPDHTDPEHQHQQQVEDIEEVFRSKEPRIISKGLHGIGVWVSSICCRLPSTSR